ncbi:hypothetical protein SAMD00019534_102860 [Acytostelium subglobosum LB1]|uniref:hypothetical protein n=1 Tax=Acytostelium subglobosum LB1 TaxID=1410327 RepID=UPI0006449E23|nr:hypothetical protein SAMD00019534_102860 [Acytostelium subglobosum LB1]GAM27111.1 hypothetical protein SAMD00019534_102860 [Acytostelium subglobosum LB1]|eukprot:XP_012749991.1 hypothetical protein SAMD00019534_102860 [Acytostelium subglobosum LB1]
MDINYNKTLLDTHLERLATYSSNTDSNCTNSDIVLQIVGINHQIRDKVFLELSDSKHIVSALINDTSKKTRDFPINTCIRVKKFTLAIRGHLVILNYELIPPTQDKEKGDKPIHIHPITLVISDLDKKKSSRAPLSPLNKIKSYLIGFKNSKSRYYITSNQLNIAISELLINYPNHPNQKTESIHSSTQQQCLLTLVSNLLDSRHLHNIEHDILKDFGRLLNNIDFESLKDRSLEQTLSYLNLAIAKPHWSYFILVDAGFISTLLTSLRESSLANDEQMDQLFNLYLMLLRAYLDCPGCYDNISLAFGRDRVEQGLFQLMLGTNSRVSPPSSYQILYFIQWIANKGSLPTNIIDNGEIKQSLFKLVVSTMANGLMNNWNAMSSVLSMVIDDIDKDDNQERMIHLLTPEKHP